ncbi:hypothetical protein BJY04DRAFT_105879 [Aspergillus karnatakaensis]|uniref:uncharacterized protein n=1 Tax=Aspergillus karnatakaensis TaxID=1810916 RepID=UPI003CCDB19F
MSNANNIPPYIPPSSVPIARELGILFGFLLASLVIMGVYAVIWRAIERRDTEKDAIRKARLVAQGVHHGRGGLHEKMLDREGYLRRVELPGNGSRSIDGGRNGNGNLNGNGDRARSANGRRERNGSRAGRMDASLRDGSVPRGGYGYEEFDFSFADDLGRVGSQERLRGVSQSRSRTREGVNGVRSGRFREMDREL